MAFAQGKYAYRISDRSGFRYRIKDMRKEWNEEWLREQELVNNRCDNPVNLPFNNEITQTEDNVFFMVIPTNKKKSTRKNTTFYYARKGYRF